MYPTPLCLKTEVAKKQALCIFNAIYDQNLNKNMKHHDALGDYYSETKMQTHGLGKEAEM